MCKLIKFKLEKNKFDDGLYFTLLNFNMEHPLIVKNGINVGYCFDFDLRKVKKGYSWDDFEIRENRFNIYFSNTTTNILNMKGNSEYEEVFYLGHNSLNKKSIFKPLFGSNDLIFWNERLASAFKILSDYATN